MALSVFHDKMRFWPALLESERLNVRNSSLQPLRFRCFSAVAEILIRFSGHKIPTREEHRPIILATSGAVVTPEMVGIRQLRRDGFISRASVKSKREFVVQTLSLIHI